MSANTVYTTTISATVTIPIDVSYVYHEGDPGDKFSPPLPSHVEILNVNLPASSIRAALDEENNRAEIEDVTLETHEAD